jgi:hypothetical protein
LRVELKKLSNNNLELSRSQLRTAADGNCLFHALFDQLSYHGLDNYAMDHHDLRARIVYELTHYMASGRFYWHEMRSPQEWQRSMSQDAYYGDNNVLLLAAQIFQRPIILVPFHPEDAHNPWGTIEFHPRDPSNLEPINLMWFSERGFFSPHFQSIRPINDIPFEVPQEQEQVQVQHATQVLVQEQEIDNLISIILSMDFGTSLLSMPTYATSRTKTPSKQL